MITNYDGTIAYAVHFERRRLSSKTGKACHQQIQMDIIKQDYEPQLMDTYSLLITGAVFKVLREVDEKCT